MIGLLPLVTNSCMKPCINTISLHVQQVEQVDEMRILIELSVEYEWKNASRYE